MLEDGVAVADEDQLVVGVEQWQRIEGAFQDAGGCLVPAHGVDGDAHGHPRG